MFFPLILKEILEEISKKVEPATVKPSNSTSFDDDDGEDFFQKEPKIGSSFFVQSKKPQPPQGFVGVMENIKKSSNSENSSSQASPVAVSKPVEVCLRNRFGQRNDFHGCRNSFFLVIACSIRFS